MSSPRSYAPIISSDKDGYGRKPINTKVYTWTLVVLVLLAIAIIISLGVALTVVASSDSGSCSTTDSVVGNATVSECDSESCRDLLSVVLARMDTTVNPCNDFYNFTCGRFEQNARAQGVNNTSSLDQVNIRNYLQLSNILRSTFHPGNLSSLQKLKTLYESCMDTDTIDRLGVQPLLDLIASTGGWELAGVPEPETWSVNGSSFLQEKLIGSPALFVFSSDVNFQDSNHMILTLQQSGLSFGVPELYSSPLWEPLLRHQLNITILQVLHRMNPNLDPQDTLTIVENMVEFEKSLAGIFVPTEEVYNVTSSFNVFTVGELATLWPDYDWEKALESAFGAVGIAVDGSEPVNVATPAYFQQLHDLILNQTDPDTVKNYAKWQLVYQFLDHVDTETTAIATELKRIALRTVDAERAISCVQMTEQVLPLALARVFVENLLPDGVTDSGAEMVNELKIALRERMNSLEWLDYFTRQRAKEKIGAMTSRVGFPAKVFNDSYLDEQYSKFTFSEDTYFSNYVQYVNESVRDGLRSLREEVDRSEYLTPPSAVNAYYNPSFNQITILAGIMVFPIFQTEWPVAYRYGALGSVVGHEITHGFDDSGRLFNPQGNLEPWWTQAVVAQYNSRTQCFVDQYDQYIDSSYGIAVNGQLTLGENIADNGGIKASYEAFTSATVKYGEQTLPDLPYTADQLFFIAWGQQWCQVSDPLSYIVAILSNVHSPGRFRVIGPLVNNADFARAFNCPVGSPMNPKDKCLLW